MLSEVPDVRMSVLVRPKGSTSGRGPGRQAAREADLRRGRRGGRRGRGGAGGARRGGRGRPGRRTRRCRATSTRSCTAPATCRSTRRSTRGSPPTSSAPATCWTGSTRRRPSPAGTSTTCTSRRRTSRAGAAAASPRRRSSTTSTSRPSSRGGSRSARRSSTAPAASTSSIKRAQEGREGAQPRRAAHRRPRDRGRAQAVGQGRAGPDRHRAGPQPGLDRLLHVHQGDGRAGGRALGRRDDPRRVSIVRPSIIESALERPHSGWIEGFKMAEPLILAYGRGELPGVPGRRPTRSSTSSRSTTWSPRSSRCSRTRREPGAGRRTSTSPSATATRSPSTSSTRRCASYFDQHPFTAGDRGAARLPEWRFPGAQSVERLLSTSEKALQGRRLHRRPRPAQRPGPRPGPQARPAGPPAGVPAPLPRPLHGVRHRPSCASPTGRRWRCTRRSRPTTGRRSPSTPRSSTGPTTSSRCTARPSRRRSAAWTSSARCARSRPRAGLRQVGLRRRAASRRSSTWTARCCPPTSSRPTCGCGSASSTAPSGSPSSAGSPSKVPSLVQAERRDRSDFLRGGLPRVRRRPARRPRRGRRRAPDRPHPVPALARRRTPDPRAPRGRPPDRADHRRDPAADPAAAAAVRPHRGRRPRRRRPRRLHRLPRLVAAGRGVAGRLDAVLRRRARHRHEGVLRLRRLATPTCRCSRPSATRSRCGPTYRSTGTRAARTGTSSTGPARPARRAPSTPRAVGDALDDARPGDVPHRCRAPWPARPSAAGCPASCPGSRRPLRLVTIDAPKVDRPGWARLRSRLSGICGSDLGALSGHDQPVLLRGRVAAVRARPRGGRRAARGLRGPARPAPASCRPGADLRGPWRRAVRGLRRRRAPTAASRITVGHLAPGLQTGFCKDTGGGWGQQLVAHRSQLHAGARRAGPTSRRCSIEPLACAVHTALRAGVRANDRVLVSGAGSVGLFATLALRQLTAAGEIIVVAKHGHQRELALRVRRDRGGRARRGAAPAYAGRPARSSSSRSSPRRTSSAASTSPSTRSAASSRWRPRCNATRAGGRVVLSGMPAAADLSAAWFRELEVVGTYASSQQRGRRPGRLRHRDRAGRARRRRAAGQVRGQLPAAPLARGPRPCPSAGRLGTVKVAFDPRS